MFSTEWQLLHLRVSAEADPGVLARILERFQNLNVTPPKVPAEWGTAGTLYVEVAITGLSEPALDLIAARLGQVPSIFNAYWHR